VNSQNVRPVLHTLSADAAQQAQRSIPAGRTRRLDPGRPKFVDVIHEQAFTQKFTVLHITHGVDQTVPRESYELLIRAHGKDVDVQKWFVAEVGQDKTNKGKLTFYPKPIPELRPTRNS
jgi:hypothetical protein